METRDAVLLRRSVRAFLDRPVEEELLTDALDTARRAPSGGNLQPWHVYALTAGPLEALKKRVAEQTRLGGPEAAPEYPIYPADLVSPFRERRYRNGEQLYAALDVPREDKRGRLEQFSRNFTFFGAPVGLFCYVHRQMGAAQWADLGMFLQTVMLLLADRGVASCAQEAWSLYHTEVAEVLDPPADLMLFCGMAIGYEDTGHPVNTLRTERAPLGEVASFAGWD
jgi:nitroreductase